MVEHRAAAAAHFSINFLSSSQVGLLVKNSLEKLLLGAWPVEVGLEHDVHLTRLRFQKKKEKFRVKLNLKNNDFFLKVLLKKKLKRFLLKKN